MSVKKNNQKVSPKAQAKGENKSSSAHVTKEQAPEPGVAWGMIASGSRTTSHERKTSEGGDTNHNHAISVSPKLEISNSDSKRPSSKEEVVNQNVTNNAWEQLSYFNSLSSANVQTKCQSCNGDIYEKQADLVADKVNKGIFDHRSNANQDESVTVLPYRNQSTQKKCSDCEEEVQRKDSSASTHSSFQNSQTLNRAINAPSFGDRVNSSIQKATEKVIGTDLSYARVHTDSSANRASASINARAFTYGKDIFMGPGESPKDTKLMSHELTHVAQQSSNKKSVQKWEGDDGDASENQQAQLSDAEIQIINDWLNGTGSDYSSQANPIYPPGYWLNSQFSQDHGFDTSLYFAPIQDDRVHLPNFNSFPDYRTSPFDHQYGFPELTNTQCPSSCHQVAGAFRAEAARRQQAARNRARLDNWGGLHQDQQGEALSQQGPDLETEIASSEFLITQIRAQMLETAASDAPNLGLDTNVHTSWAAAQQETLLLESFIQSSTVDFELSLQGSIKQTYHLFFSSLIGALREEDRIAQAREDTLNNADPCPSCHSATTPELPAFDYGMYEQPSVMPSLLDQPSHSSQTMTLSAFVNGLAEPAEQVQEEPVGERVQRLADIQGRIINAGDRSSWQEIVADFEWATGQIDNVLRRLSRSNTLLKELFDQLEYSKQLLNRQQTLLQSHPNAMRVQAVFYPKPESVTELEQELSAQGEQVDVARSIPWQFYLTHTPVAGDGSLPSDFQWELHDLTAPNRASTAKVRYSPTTPERFGMTMSGDLETQLKRPPEALFEKLNDSDFFAEGMLYYNMPYDRSGALGGETKSLETTEPWSLGDWLKAIGLSVMVIGSLVFAPFSTPALIAFGVGAAFSAAGGLYELMDKQEKGTLTNADIGRFFWDLSLDIVSGITMGLGRIARVAVAANNMHRAARLGNAWVLLRRAEFATDLANIAVFGASTLENYQRIQSSNMTPEQKREAIANLTMMSLGMGLISVIPVATGARELRQGRSALNLGIDQSDARRLTAQIEPDLDGAAHTASRNTDTAPIRTVSAGHGHSYGIWPDGRITKCSPPPCPEFVELIVDELDDLRVITSATSDHQNTFMDLANDVASLRTDATRAAGRSTEALEEASPELLRRTGALETRLISLRQAIEEENRILALRGREAAEHQYGSAALNYNRDHYMWVRLQDGTLEFRRRIRTVPRLKFDVNNGFSIDQSLFRNVDPDVRQRTLDHSLTRRYDILSTVRSRADLDRVRPISPYRQNHSDWVVVRIDDHNFHEFAGGGIRAGVIFEFPDGSKMWRTRDNQIATDYALGTSVGRRGFELMDYPQYRQWQNSDGELVNNEGIRVTGDAEGINHQRSHQSGQWSGFESPFHIPLAPEFINQQMQARGIELFMSKLRELSPNADFRIHTLHETFPGTRRQDWINYHISVVEDGVRRELVDLRITTDYTDRLQPAQVQINSMSPDHQAQAFLNGIDMNSARREMEQRIREAIARRRASGTLPTP